MIMFSVLERASVEELRNCGWDNDLIKKYDEYVDRRHTIARRGRSANKDSEMSKVYKAEFAFAARLRENGISNTTYADIEEANKMMRRVMKSKAWESINHGSANINLVYSGRFSQIAGNASYGTITLGRFGLNLYTLLHEMAHCAGHMHHDVSFRQALVRLVSRFMGTVAAELLKKSFKDQGLKMHRKMNIMGPEEWLGSYNKMAAARTKIVL